MRWLPLVATTLLAACGAPLPLAMLPQDREPVPQPVGTAPRQPVSEWSEPARLGEDGAMSAFSFGIGAYYWDELGDLSTAGTGWRPDQFGQFDRWGFAADLAFDRMVGRVGDGAWSLGFQFGVGTFQNEGSGVSPFSDRLDATLLHVVPTARIRVPLADGLTLVPGAGFGGYWMSIDEYDRDYWGYSYYSRRLHDEWAWGGFASVGLEIDVGDSGGALQIDNEFHWVDFDGIDSVLPAQDSLGGLIYGLQLGFTMRF